MAAIPDHEQGVDAISLCCYVFQLKFTDELIQFLVGAIPQESCILYAQALEDFCNSLCVFYYLSEILMACLVVYFVEYPQSDKSPGHELWKWHVVRSFRGWEHFINKSSN